LGQNPLHLLGFFDSFLIGCKVFILLPSDLMLSFRSAAQTSPESTALIQDGVECIHFRVDPNTGTELERSTAPC
jgi:hypothetical protein